MNITSVEKTMKISVLALAGAFLVAPSFAFARDSGATSPETRQSRPRIAKSRCTGEGRQ